MFCTVGYYMERSRLIFFAFKLVFVHVWNLVIIVSIKIEEPISFMTL